MSKFMYKKIDMLDNKVFKIFWKINRQNSNTNIIK